MPADDDPLDRTIDELGAARLTLMAFMVEVGIRLAKDKPDPTEWAQDFISSLHHRLDRHEAWVGDAATGSPFHELARENVDVVGEALLQAFRPRQE